MTRLVPVLLVALAACGNRGPVDAGASTTSTTLSAVTTTTAPAAATTPVPTTRPAAGGGSTTDVAVWFIRGESLESVTRAVPSVARVGAEAVKALLGGPTAAESRGGLATAIPADTRFNDLAIEDGIAKVDLSRAFESGGGSLGLTLRLAQVTCTVGQFPSVKGVRFALAGELVSVFSGDGIVLDKPVTCDSYRQVQATFAGIWPFATRAELEAYAAGADTSYRDPVATAREFAARYVGMDNPVTFPFKSTGPGAGDVPVGFRYNEGHVPAPNPQATFTVAVRQLGAQGPSGPWTVVGAASPTIVVAAPRALDRVTSPVRPTGSGTAFEGNINVQVREDGMVAGQALGKGFVTGGGDEARPLTGEVAFKAPSKPAGALVFVVLSPADGQGILRATVVRVRF